MDLAAYLKDRKSLVEAALSRSLDDGRIPPRLKEAMLYSLNAGGKRLRPILVIAGAEAVGGSADAVMGAACAIEMIHTFSLIHDDLPAMDDDSLRRGMPTNHKVFGEATAILAGDGLLAEAFYVLASADGCRDPRAVLEVVRDIAEATGPRGMTGGQVLDMEATGERIGLDALERLHLYKTGALIAVSATSGAKLCGAKPEEVAALKRYGEAVGLAFQIADDILDIEGDEKELGKDIGSDEANEKSTFPSLLGIEESKRRAAGLVRKAREAVSVFGRRAEPLEMIAAYAVERRS